MSLFVCGNYDPVCDSIASYDNLFIIDLRGT